jgi:hypothetical protein
MACKEPQRIIKLFCRSLGVLIFVGWVIFSGPANAALTAQDVTGTVDTAEESAPVWEPLAAAQPVDVGELVRTDFSAKTDLKGDDGSLLYVDEATQLAIREFEFNPDQQIRIARFAIIEGTVTAEAAQLAYATNIFDVETPTVVASFKFSKLTIQVDEQGNTKLTPHSGMFAFTREGKGKKGTVAMTHKSADDVETTFNVPPDGNVGFGITADGVKIENLGDTPLKVTIGGKTIEMPAGTSIEGSTGGGQLTVKNTTDPSATQQTVTVNGKAIGAGKESVPMSIMSATSLLPGQSTGIQDITSLFHSISSGSTSSSVPTTTGGAANNPTIGLPNPGIRQAGRRTVRIEIEIRSD